MEDILDLRGADWYIFLFVLFGILICVGLTNYLIDPYGWHGTDILKAQRIDSRTRVEKMLRNQWNKPDVMLFGSSRSMSLKPNFGKESIGVNAALFAGAIEDHYCILRYSVESLSFPLRFAVIGLEPDLFLSTHPIDPMLIKNKRLGRYLEKKNISIIQAFFKQPGYVDEVASLLSFTTSKNSCKIIFGFLMDHFDPKGAITDIKQISSSGLTGYLLEIIKKKKDSMTARLRQYKKLYSGAVAIDADRLRYLYRFADYAKKNSIAVVAFYPGYSRGFWNEMINIDAFIKSNQKLDQEMMKLKKLYGWRLIDFRPGKFKGSELQFFDGVHPTKQTTLIIEKIISNKVINDL
ncbi:hypothetical protein [Desulfobacula phenolica]|uniref:hypothetical protein n=1 Tax=Desulfobacula phenolica TaxID=90732 RepID=UPI0011140E38|nr:hypothetical protein [Desulfobacula phenolica]